MTDRLVVTGAELDAEAHSLLNRVVIPRPIAWVSTTSAGGVDNLAPHSYFTISALTPPTVQFTSIGRKDTLRNVLATGEFVVNFTPERLIDQINATSTDFPPEISEFDEAGLTRRPSVLVAPPSVAESPAAIECELSGTREFGDDVIVFGRVVAITVAAGMVGDRGPEATLLRPIARLGGIEWSGLGAVSARRRVSWSG